MLALVLFSSHFQVILPEPRRSVPFAADGGQEKKKKPDAILPRKRKEGEKINGQREREREKEREAAGRQPTHCYL
jgi:hypothetical protein